ncbi:hypothetical protein [Thaumasiovibrio subtropicus]|nr:hypothetical protein [Thaumasiovibrio subtropicus]
MMTCQGFVAPTDEELIVKSPEEVYVDQERDAEFDEFNDIIIL